MLEVKQRALNKNTIKPIIKFIGGWNSSIYRLNTEGATHYHFTLDTYNGKNSFTGGFAWDLNGCYGFDKQPYDKYAIDLKTGDVYNLSTGAILFTVK